MPDIQPVSFPPLVERPRPPRQEVADLLAMAMMRLRAKGTSDAVDDCCGVPSADSEPIELGFPAKQRVNTRLVSHKPARS